MISISKEKWEVLRILVHWLWLWQYWKSEKREALLHLVLSPFLIHLLSLVIFLPPGCLLSLII